MKFPCKNCQRRTMTCHDSKGDSYVCSDYAEFVKAKALQNARDKEFVSSCYAVERQIRKNSYVRKQY